MEKPSKLNERLTLVANVAVVVGIVLVAFQLQQNTRAIQAQTRDSITEKQMTYYGWIATNGELAAIEFEAASGLQALDPLDRNRFTLFTQAVFREWENTHYQFERGLFTLEEYEPRIERWRQVLDSHQGVRESWMESRGSFSPSFRSEVDQILEGIDD